MRYHKLDLTGSFVNAEQAAWVVETVQQALAA
jgi:hypothetical protein